MKNADFVTLLTANCNKTKSVRCYSKVWPSGARRIPIHILNQVGRIVAFIQAKVNEGVFCNPHTEGILVYNFQPLLITTECKFCTIDALVVSRAQLDVTWELKGSPFHLVLNLLTSEIVNNTKSMLDLELVDEQEIDAEGMERPIVWGKFTEYEPTTVFVPLASASPFTNNEIFSGALDHSDVVRLAPHFDSHLEAQEYLRKSGLPHTIICELEGCKKEAPNLIKKGLSKHTLKVMSENLDGVCGTSNKEVGIEARQEDEIRLLLISKFEEERKPEETVLMAKQ